MKEAQSTEYQLTWKREERDGRSYWHIYDKDGHRVRNIIGIEGQLIEEIERLSNENAALHLIMYGTPGNPSSYAQLLNAFAELGQHVFGGGWLDHGSGCNGEVCNCGLRDWLKRFQKPLGVSFELPATRPLTEMLAEHETDAAKKPYLDEARGALTRPR